VPDRTILPLHEPQYPHRPIVDVRKAPPPPPVFEVTAPAGAPNVLIVLIDDMGFGQSSAFGGPVHMPTVERHLVTTILKSAPSAQGTALSELALADIPVDIGGTMTEPTVRPDLRGILKSQMNQKFKDTLQNQLQRLINR
jgi:hypothetical protein